MDLIYIYLYKYIYRERQLYFIIIHILCDPLYFLFIFKKSYAFKNMFWGGVHRFHQIAEGATAQSSLNPVLNLSEPSVCPAIK